MVRSLREDPSSSKLGNSAGVLLNTEATTDSTALWFSYRAGQGIDANLPSQYRDKGACCPYPPTRWHRPSTAKQCSLTHVATVHAMLAM